MIPDYVETLRTSLVYVAERQAGAEREQAFDTLQSRKDLPLGSLPKIDEIVAVHQHEANRAGYTGHDHPLLGALAFEVAGRAAKLRAGAT